MPSRPVRSSKSRASKSNDTSQHARFIETARALGCNEAEAAFDEKLKALARRRPAQKDEATKHADSSNHKAED